MDSPEKFLFALKLAKWTQNKTFLNVTHIFAMYYTKFQVIDLGIQAQPAFTGSKLSI